MKLSLCKDFSVVETDYGARVLTPFRFADHDQVVVWVKRGEQGYSLDDNGEAAFRLTADGVDTGGERIQTWLQTLPGYLGVRWDDKAEMLVSSATEKTLEEKVLAVAQSAIQLSAFSALRNERLPSDFKETVITMLEEIGKELGFSVQRDQPMDEGGYFTADALLSLKKPVAVITATSSKRLLEAEVMWSEAQRHGRGVYVLALVETMQAVGIKEYTRANYFTDKTVEFSGRTLLKGLIQAQATSH